MFRYVVLVTRYLGIRTYGIGLVRYEGWRPVLIASYADLSHRRTDVDRLVRACNREQLDPAHLGDVVEDFVAGL